MDLGCFWFILCCCIFVFDDLYFVDLVVVDLVWCHPRFLPALMLIFQEIGGKSDDLFSVELGDIQIHNRVVSVV